ncbi:phosphotransferase family protein [Legionella spiritensis]|uniref:Homoserine kinase n=1 Tax=Legionella spiritensis TaxID=452 RepID=A0A0W0Z549_LEGSP|nr:aminoglycoside phosphotransferase family protein [Legionella spiritensis]KTD64288.1 Homoserine kinase [Legionella spiritensis]SNV46893.1 homoserine kinase [Legionella spiritensis]
MTFKQHWEKTDAQIQLPEKTIKAMLEIAFPQKTILSYQLISGGCANLNYKIDLENEEFPYILRIYLRDKNAAFREKNLASLLKNTVPVPLIYRVDDYDNYRFAVTRYMSGISLRDLLLGKEPYDLQTIMFDAGAMLAKIQNHRFLKAGFFNPELEIVKTPSQFDLMAFAKECMQHENTINLLKTDLLARADSCLSTFKDCFPDEKMCSLVHGDFDPANILVTRENGQWFVAGILDWEFSFSGSPLWDVANMLRYAHEMPAEFEDFFLKGLKTGYHLPPDWRISIHLLNLLSLLDCLVRSSLETTPNRCQDIHALIAHIITQLENGYD